MEAFDLDANTGGIREHIQFFYPNLDRGDVIVSETNGGDPFGQCLDQIDMAAAHQRPHIGDECFIAQYIGQPVLDRTVGFDHIQVEINAHPLPAVLLVSVDTDQTGQHQVVDKNMTGTGNALVMGHGVDNAGFAHYF